MSSEIKKQSYPGFGTKPYTGENPNQIDYQEGAANAARMPKPSKTYAWVVRGNNIRVTDLDRSSNLFAVHGIKEDHHGPLAKGTVDVSSRWTASFTVDKSNIDLDNLYRIFKKWANSPEFITSKEDGADAAHDRWPTRLHVAVVKDKNGIPLPLGISKTAADPGIGDDHFKYPWKNTDKSYLTDIQIQDNDRGKLPGQGDLKNTDGTLADDVYECDECDEVFDSYAEYLLHVGNDHLLPDPSGHEEEIHEKGGIAGMDYDNEMGRSNGRMFEAATSEVELEGPIPFSFDVEDDRLYVGEIGDERVDIDPSNPFGRAEGYYTPDGDLLITGQSTVPYTINHLTHLWEDMYPEHEIKHVYLIQRKDNRDIKEKLSNV